jgi:predicted ATPase/transcriptional regulator with XRE-family HTH domain
MHTFGEWLRYQRTQLHLTREQFADRVGCSIALLRKIEDGERRPSEQIAGLIANCLNVPPEYRPTFVKVARGELSVERLSHVLKSAAAPPIPRINLPVLPTPLIGRQRELDQLGRLLRDPQCRLLTLVGPGGMGKTRLAIEAAAHIQDEFTGGVYFVPLAPVNATRYVVPVIADAIGFAFQSASQVDPKTQIFSYLKEKQALLLLDNLEQLLVEPGIELLAELLASAPQVKLLATSRESLGLQGEWVFEIQGLPVPESEYEQSRMQNTSVELFLQRARRAYVGFDATPVDYPAIVRICQLVEGNPLGIELAAAWVRTLSCAEIAGEIERGLGFLGVSTRDIPARHRSLRAVFGHSWKLLPQEEQAVLLRLSTFRGGFQREAAQAVAGATLAILSSLVTKSIVRRSINGRYDLHELIRQFALERLAESPEEQVATQARHGSYYLTLFSLAEGRIHSAAQREALAELTAETDNFRAGWEWAVAHGEFALIEQTLRTFATLFDMRGWLQEGRDMLDRAVDALETAQTPAALDRTNQIALGHILAVRSLLVSRLGRHDQAQTMLERSLDILRPLHEPRVLVEAVTFLGLELELTGNYARALELYSEGLEIARQIGDRWFAALCFTCVSGLVGFTQTLVTPEVRHARWQSSVADWRRIGDPRFTAIGLNNLSLSALWLGRYDEARLALEESVALGISVGDRWGLGFAYRGLGIIAQAQGEHLEALAMFRKSLDTLGELGARQDVARVLAEMGRSVFALGNDVEAGRIWRQALRIATETKGTFIALEALLGLASLRARSGDVEQAFELLWIVLNHPASVQDTQNRAARLRSELEAQLTSQQVQAARAQAKTLEVAVEEVLKQTEGE